jgi:asparagine synthase (glutamine-hydrolysing)
MFRAPFDSFHEEHLPPYVDQLLSAESLRKAGYFNAEAVARWRKEFRNLRQRSHLRTSIEMGLVGVFATQLWHHTYIQGLAEDLPTWSPHAATAAAIPEKRLVIGAGKPV